MIKTDVQAFERLRAAASNRYSSASRTVITNRVRQVMDLAEDARLSICDLSRLAELAGCKRNLSDIEEHVAGLKLRAQQSKEWVQSVRRDDGIARIAALLFCDPTVDAIVDRLSYTPDEFRKGYDRHSVFAAIARALNWKRTEFDTLEELLDEIRRVGTQEVRPHSVYAGIARALEWECDEFDSLDAFLAELNFHNCEMKCEAVRRHESRQPQRAVDEPGMPHTLLHAGELYRDVTLLLHTEQLVAWRTADGQEYSARAHQVLLDPDEDGLAAAILSRIAGVEIAPEHMAELRAQMAGGVK